MSRCGTVRSLPVAAASAGLRDSGIGAPPQSDPSCAPGRAAGVGELCTPQSPPLHLGYLGVALSSGTCWQLHPTGGQRDGKTLWTPHGGENGGIGTPQGMQRDGVPAGGHPSLGTRDGAHAGGHPVGGMDRGMCTPQRDRGVRNILGCEDAHEGVTPRGTGGREEAQLGDTPERGW